MADPLKPRLFGAGALLFLLGLLTGLLLTLGDGIVNPRLVLAGHLEGVMNGTFLMVVALGLDHVRLSPTGLRRVAGLLTYGAYVNWLATTAGGLLGTSEATPLSGAGHHAAPIIEKAMFGVLATVALATVAGMVGLLVGVRRRVGEA
jgi:hydroxylaminobenzene mutase